MTEITSPASQEPAWRRPATWVREESFWRDVATRTLAALISALIIYLFAVAAGYIGRPSVWPVIVAGGLPVLGLLVGSWASRWSGGRSGERMLKRLHSDGKGDAVEMLRLLNEERGKIDRREHRVLMLLLALTTVGASVLLVDQLL